LRAALREQRGTQANSGCAKAIQQGQPVRAGTGKYLELFMWLILPPQLVTILTRMANRGHERALLAQGAIPTLCQMLRPPNSKSIGGRQAELERRIAYKAAVCLGCLASTGSGLRGLHEQNGELMAGRMAGGEGQSGGLAYYHNSPLSTFLVNFGKKFRTNFLNLKEFLQFFPF
jgi:hypothetical protein